MTNLGSLVSPQPSHLRPLMDDVPLLPLSPPPKGPSLFGALVKKQRQFEEQKAAAAAAAAATVATALASASAPPCPRISPRSLQQAHKRSAVRKSSLASSSASQSVRSPSRLSTSSTSRQFVFSSPPRIDKHSKRSSEVSVRRSSHTLTGLSSSASYRNGANAKSKLPSNNPTPLSSHAHTGRMNPESSPSKSAFKMSEIAKSENTPELTMSDALADDGDLPPPSFPPGHVIAEIVDTMLRKGRSVDAEKLKKTARRHAHVSSMRSESSSSSSRFARPQQGNSRGVHREQGVSGNSDTEYETNAHSRGRDHAYSESLRRRSGAKRRRSSIDEVDVHSERRSVSSSMERTSAAGIGRSRPSTPLRGAFSLQTETQSSSSKKVSRHGNHHSDVSVARKRKRRSNLTLPRGLPTHLASPASSSSSATLGGLGLDLNDGGSSGSLTEDQQRAWRDYLGGLSLDLTLSARGESSEMLATRVGMSADQVRHFVFGIPSRIPEEWCGTTVQFSWCG